MFMNKRFLLCFTRFRFSAEGSFYLIARKSCSENDWHSENWIRFDVVFHKNFRSWLSNSWKVKLEKIIDQPNDESVAIIFLFLDLFDRRWRLDKTEVQENFGLIIIESFPHSKKGSARLQRRSSFNKNSRKRHPLFVDRRNSVQLVRLDDRSSTLDEKLPQWIGSFAFFVEQFSRNDERRFESG